MSKTYVHDYSMKVCRPWAQLSDHAEYGGWTDGEVVTPSGIVSVYSQYGEYGEDKHTSLRFVWGGRQHTRSIGGKHYSHRGLVTVAARFAAEISALN